MSFKLIAIRPLSECNSNFLKNLQPNYIYQLDQNYNFYDFNNNILDDTVSENLIEKISHEFIYPNENISVLENLLKD